ncbi:MAG: hypothetical protein JRI23_27025 [Deltaproteobacteria bacterium]|jgi:hypothetical protein|nr:hypothetical protein [Deltaproteobacteria bacterium]MBW2535726.1 hypothetical protein [Deltaproteobacteria bacterium]
MSGRGETEREPSFKTCSSCGHRWPTRQSFLDDPEIVMIGYQSFMPDPELGMFMFNHACGTTLTLQAIQLADLVDGPIYGSRWARPPQEPESCLADQVDHPCPTSCECHYVERVSKSVRRPPSDPASKR